MRKRLSWLVSFRIFASRLSISKAGLTRSTLISNGVKSSLKRLHI